VSHESAVTCLFGAMDKLLLAASRRFVEHTQLIARPSYGLTGTAVGLAGARDSKLPGSPSHRVRYLTYQLLTPGRSRPILQVEPRRSARGKDSSSTVGATRCVSGTFGLSAGYATATWRLLQAER